MKGKSPEKQKQEGASSGSSVRASLACVTTLERLQDMDAKASMETEVSSCRRLDFDKVDQITNDEVSTPPVLNVIKDINKIHTLIPFELIPKMGMEFESEEDAYNFYLAYAKEVGFGIKRSSFHKDSNGKLMDRVFCCSAEGKRGKDKRDLNVRAPRPETRFNCSAKMKVNSR